MQNNRKAFLGADHRGFSLKSTLIESLTKKGYSVVDCGNSVYDPEDHYPKFALAVGEAVVSDVSRSEKSDYKNELGQAQNPDKKRGIVICGSGVGVIIAANKVKGIRAGFALNEAQVRSATKDDKINVLAIASDHISEERALDCALAFLETEFGEAQRYQDRIDMIEDYERSN